MRSASFPASMASERSWVQPERGNVFPSVKDADRPRAIEVGQDAPAWIQRPGNARQARGVDAIRAGNVAMVANPMSSPADQAGSFTLRREALQNGVAAYTAARAAEVLAAEMKRVGKGAATGGEAAGPGALSPPSVAGRTAV